MSPRVAEDGGGWAAPPGPPFGAPTAETRDVWGDGREPVATVAAVAELTGDKPWAADLNRLFCTAGCARYAGEAWRGILLALHRFADQHAQAALDAGWEAIELVGVRKGAFLSDDVPMTHRGALRGMRGDAAAFVVGKREVLEITPEFIKIVVDRQGNIGRLYREHHMANRLSFGLPWEVPLF